VTRYVHIRFYAELNDFLAPERQGRSFSIPFHVGPTVRDLIESAGVPHTEVDLVLVNGQSVDFSHQVRDGDRVSVYPVFESLDISPLARVRPQPLRHLRFVLDVHLGRLAAYLRMLGFDVLYRNDYGDEELARLSSEEDRVLLTRDLGLLKRARVTRGYYVRETSPRAQLADVVGRFDLAPLAQPFARCLACNRLLETAPAGEVAGAVPPGVLARHSEFLRCPGCRRVYWKGTHYDRMQRLIAELARATAR
jgi:uncharacterized protein with PIN domain/sulfur carrier protein ThiS